MASCADTTRCRSFRRARRRSNCEICPARAPGGSFARKIEGPSIPTKNRSGRGCGPDRENDGSTRPAGVGLSPGQPNCRSATCKRQGKCRDRQPDELATGKTDNATRPRCRSGGRAIYKIFPSASAEIHRGSLCFGQLRAGLYYCHIAKRFLSALPAVFRTHRLRRKIRPSTSDTARDQKHDPVPSRRSRSAARAGS